MKGRRFQRGFMGAAAAQHASRRQLLFIGEGHANSAGSATYHASSVEGDLLVLVLISVTDPGAISGWTQQFAFTSSSTYYHRIYTKIKGSDTAVTIPGTNGGGAVCTFRGGSGVPSTGTVGSATENNSATINASAITPQDVLSTVIAVCIDRDVSVPSLPSTFTNIANFTSVFFGWRIAYKNFASISSTGAVAFTQSTSSFNAVAWLIEMKP